MRSIGPPASERPAGRRPLQARVETVAALTSVFWLFCANRPFLLGALRGREVADASAWGLAMALMLALLALHFFLLLLVANRWTIKPLIGFLLLGTAFASWFMDEHGVYLDPGMLRNVLNTDVAEARELFSARMLPHLLWQALLPMLLLWRVDIVRQPLGRASAVRAGALTLALVVLIAAVMAVFQPLSSLMRSQKELRFLITPANYLWSLGVVAAGDTRQALLPRIAVGEDARLGPGSAAPSRPTLLVIVVGETARAANWGLSGYARATTPLLAQLPVLNFAHVRSCGTNTEVSLPCMFAPVGRREYNEDAIRRRQSLLHVLARAGVGVHWLDNQSGCKGVCEGLSYERVLDRRPTGVCEADRCHDEGLLDGLDQRLATARGTQVLILHQLGNHGPAYFRRYPPAFAHFKPACEHDDLGRCSVAEIVNAYDNALRYTDHVLARLVGQLQARSAQVDSAMIYVSDHGESLGENGLFLHGLPYAIAPDVQTHVPMVMWWSAGFEVAARLDRDCMRRRAAKPASHDHLFHTVLSLLDVQTRALEPAWDLTQGCRR